MDSLLLSRQISVLIKLINSIFLIKDSIGILNQCWIDIYMNHFYFFKRLELID